MAKYLRYVIRNIEPLRIADDSTSQRGQTATLHYIPGSTVRGLVVNALCKDDKFEILQKELFSAKIRFLNAYPITEMEIEGEKTKIKELIPSPKGFYEDKTECNKKEIRNIVVDGGFSGEGWKRASLGRYCYLNDDCIYYYQVETGSDLKIKKNLLENEKRNVFRSEYIMPNHRFAGYIAIENEELGEYIREVFDQLIVLGNGRFTGMGKCLVESCTYCEMVPYEAYQAAAPMCGECYMMLLSNTVMRNENGEYCGLNLEALSKQMGVTNLCIKFCSTSTVEVKGFNRKWGGKIPSVVMFEQGSVFHLSYEGILTEKCMKKIADRGIGIRRNEGFGRIIFLENYEQLHYKQEGCMILKNTFQREDLEANQEQENLEANEEQEVLKLAARCYYKNLIAKAIRRYVVDHPLKMSGISNSQLGQIGALAASYQYEPEEGIKAFQRFFDHASEKEEGYNIQKKRNSVGRASQLVQEILNQELEETLDIQTKEQDTVMGIEKKVLFSSGEQAMLKRNLLVTWIRHNNKRQKGDV